jgi:hypothetical protein
MSGGVDKVSATGERANGGNSGNSGNSGKGGKRGSDELVNLPCTAALLVAGGDMRIMLDPVSGWSRYGCQPCPDPDLVALGSCTASIISKAGMAAADALRLVLVEQLLREPPADVYAVHAARLRTQLGTQLLQQCALKNADADADADVILAASGTDLMLLTVQWLQPTVTVLVAGMETGSGVPAALQGRHFNRRAAGGDAVAPGAALSSWHGDIAMLAVRAHDGSLIDASEVDAACMATVDCACRAAVDATTSGKVLLLLTDVSKTGLITPGIATVQALQRRWPEQLEVLVDACQFRLASSTLKAYLAQGWTVALTGSKFIGGPTFCAALLVPPAIAARYRERALPAQVGAYVSAADWPAGWLAQRALPERANFGLLLRWQAALAEIRAFVAIAEPDMATFLQRFAQAVGARLAADPHFDVLPVAPLDRSALYRAVSGLESEAESESESESESGLRWDAVQTIFPFLVLHRAGQKPTCPPACPLSCTETDALYLALRSPAALVDVNDDNAAAKIMRRFQLGQPVPCGNRDGVDVSALRLCVGAAMVVDACRGRGADAVIADALAALDRIVALVAPVALAVPLDNSDAA